MPNTELLTGGALTVAQAIAFSGLGRSTLYALMTTGELPYSLVAGRRRRLIPRKALENLIAAGMVGGPVLAGK